MFEFKGTAADNTEGQGLDWRVVDHYNIQDLGKRPFTAMVQPARSQRTRSEGTKRPSLQLRLRSNSSLPSYPRPQDQDDHRRPTTAEDRQTPRSSVERRPSSGGSTYTRDNTLDGFSPKAWIAKGSGFLKRRSSKQELTSLRTLDWVERSEEAHVHHGQGQPPTPGSRHSGTQTTGNYPAPRHLNISEPFNFRHITHTQPHHARKLERASPRDLISEFAALRAAQPSQPELIGIKARDIQQDDLPQDALLPDSPSLPRNGHGGVPPPRPARLRGLSLDTSYDVMSPTRTEHSSATDDFSQASAAYHTAHSSPMSPRHQTSSRDPTTDFSLFHHDSAFDSTPEPLGHWNYSEPEYPEYPKPLDYPGPLDYPIGTWNDGVYDLASPHAVTTDDIADWNRYVPFTMVKTELAPVEEDDEVDEEDAVEKREVFRGRPSRSKNPKTGLRFTKSSPDIKMALPQGFDACTPAAEDIPGGSAHPMPPAEESPRSLSTSPIPVADDVHGSLQRVYLPSANISELSIVDLGDDIPVRSRLSRHTSLGLDDMERFWDLASDAINCSYELGAEANSFFDWHRSSTHEGELTAPAVDDTLYDVAPSRNVTNRSSSVYSSSPPSPLPLQIMPKSAPPSAGFIQSSPRSVPAAVASSESAGSIVGTSFSHPKGWPQRTCIASSDLEFLTASDDLYQQIFTSDDPHDVPFQLHHLGRLDGSPISNSPRSSRSPISKCSSQESFLHAPGATAQDSFMPPPPQAAAGRRMRSGSSASSLNGRGSKGSYNLFPPPHPNTARNP